MPKTKWDGAEEPTIKNFYKIDNMKFWIIMLIKSVDRPKSTAVFHINRSR